MLFIITGILNLLHRIPSRQDLDREMAAKFAAHPKEVEVDFPFGTFVHASFSTPGTSSATPAEPNTQPPKKRHGGGQDEPQSKRHKKDNPGIIVPKNDDNMKKYSSVCKSNNKCLNKDDFYKMLPSNMSSLHWISEVEKLNAGSVSKKTWDKYNSAMNKLKCFANSTNTLITWPLSNDTLNGFVTWCAKNKLKASTIQSYIMAISHVQKAKGFDSIGFNKTFAKILLNGVENLQDVKRKKFKPKKAVTFKKLWEIKKKLNKKKWSKRNKMIIWTCMITGFFGSFRMGELLAEKSKTFDVQSNLTWNDITFKKGSVKIHIKKPKSNNKNGENVYIFPFPVKKCCPVHYLDKMKKHQMKHNVYGKNLPVFRFSSGKNVTKNDINKILETLLKSKNYSCKSFRCGIPSSIGKFPDIANDQHIKAWGRWKSNTFLRYEHGGIPQMKWVFDKIVRCLLKEI